MKSIGLYILMIVISLSVWGIFAFTRDTVKEVVSPEWCMIADLPLMGGSFSESGAGEYQYQIVNTEGGYKVFQKCAKMK